MLATTLRLLTFRLTPEEFDRLGARHLLLGLATAWLVGYGRWWDRPDSVDPLLRSGAVSVLIVLGLGLLLHATLAPLRPRRGGLLRITAYVSLTSLPAALYALPLERWMELEAARVANLALLALVATWRVALYVRLVRRIAELPLFATVVASLLPLTLVVFGLTLSGLLLGVFQLMAGGQGGEPPPTTPAESRYEVIAALGYASLFLGPLLLVLWLAAWWRARRGVVAARRDSA